MGIKLISLFVTTLILISNVNASVIRTLNGINYEWLELTETAGLSRNAVEQRLLDPNDELYGYHYASRILVEELLLSYAPFYGNGYHSNVEFLTGMTNYLSDFGALIHTEVAPEWQELEGYASASFSYAMYGTSLYEQNDPIWGGSGSDSFCFQPTQSCESVVEIRYDSNGAPILGNQFEYQGWSSTASYDLLKRVGDGAEWSALGSHLVRLAPVPIPPTIWLFGSGLIGLIGLARRKA
jgi:hypothetical protein